MTPNKRLLPAFLCIFFFSQAYAANPAILSANNQASVNALLQYQNLDYSGGDKEYPLHNLHGKAYGFNFNLNKTFFDIYTAISLSASNGTLSYNNPAVNLSEATNFQQQITGRLGYSFYPEVSMALTPYLMLGYQHQQLDTGGTPIAGSLSNGITQVYQAFQAGAGLLAQWAATPRWVLGADLMAFSHYRAWTYATIPKDDNFYYQQATLSQQITWQAAINSDYKLSGKLHGLLGVKYLRSTMGSGQTNTFSLTVPTQQSRQWQYSAGLGYDLDAAVTEGAGYADHRASLIAANNQADFFYGLLFDNYGEIQKSGGYLDRETGEMPQWGIRLSKTWRNIYGQAVYSQAFGNTRYHGSNVFTGAPLEGTTANTMMDVYGRLGYQFIVLPQASITPYGILGYHRWLRSIGYPETYHNNWAGLGVLLQWAPISRLVLSLDGNTGNTFNAQIHTWNTFYPPDTVLFESNLGSRSYVMAGAGADLQFAKAWHALANVNYWRFNYGAGPPANKYGDHEPTSNTRLMSFTLGLGYSW